jgi:hypothetical protein
MDKDFEKWMQEFEKDWRDSKSYNVMVGKGWSTATYQLLTWYIQFKSSEKLLKLTRWLVYGTWILAIGTILVLFFK